MNKLTTIAVFTSIRSDYEPLKSLLHALKQHSYFQLKLLVGGAHLLEDYGLTKNQIIKDGFDINAEFNFFQNSDAPDNATKSMATLQMQFGSWLVNNKPDMVILLGDRFELLPIASACLVYNIPIGHVSGGDVTEGAIDNQVRNALTKMASVHFPATEIYKQNILKMGEEEWRICVSGEPGLDDVLKINFMSKDELFHELKLNMDKPVICITIHPETISHKIDALFVEKLLLKIVHETDFQIVVTASNFDNGGFEINQTLEKIALSHSTIVFVKNLGQLRYYSLLKYATLMLGNSSSGIWEAQSFNLPVINIGDRQTGRLANKCVHHTNLDVDVIVNAINYVLSKTFLNTFKNQPNIYGNGNASKKIIEYLEEVDVTKLLAKKSTF